MKKKRKRLAKSKSDSSLIEVAKATGLILDLAHPAFVMYRLWSISMLPIVSPPRKEREHDL